MTFSPWGPRAICRTMAMVPISESASGEGSSASSFCSSRSRGGLRPTRYSPPRPNRPVDASGCSVRGNATVRRREGPADRQGTRQAVRVQPWVRWERLTARNGRARSGSARIIRPVADNTAPRCPARPSQPDWDRGPRSPGPGQFLPSLSAIRRERLDVKGLRTYRRSAKLLCLVACEDDHDDSQTSVALFDFPARRCRRQRAGSNRVDCRCGD